MTYAFGDSIMKGIITDLSQIETGKIGRFISDRCFINLLGTPIRNYARFGSTTPDGQRIVGRHQAEIQSGDTVLLEYGGNDCNFDWRSIAENPQSEAQPAVTLAQFANTYQQIIQQIKSIGAQPILLSLPALHSQRFFHFVGNGLNKANILKWLGGSVVSIDNWHEQYNLEVFKLGLQCQVPVIDISTTFLQRRNLEDYICEDGIHPNERGHALIAQAIQQSHLLSLQEQA